MPYKKSLTLSFDNYTMWDAFFFIWFFAEFCLYHSLVDTLSVIAFIAIALLYISKSKFYFNAIAIWMGVFTIIGWVNIWLGYSINHSNSYAMATTNIKNFLFLVFFTIYIWHVGIERVKSNFVVASIISSLFIIIYSLLTRGTLVVRAANGIFNANYIAVCNTIAAVIVLSKNNITIAKRISLIMFFALFGALAGTRKALVALICGIVVYFCAKYPQKLIKNVFIFLILLIVSYLALTRVPYLYNIIGYRFVDAFDFINGGKGDGSMYMRSWYIKKGLTMYRESPIWGHGLNCFKTLEGTLNTYSHNNYVELLFSLGLVGTISYYSIHAISLLYGLFNYKKLEKTNVSIGFAILTIVLFTDYAMVSYYERSSLMYIVLFYTMLTQTGIKTTKLKWLQKNDRVIQER